MKLARIIFGTLHQFLGALYWSWQAGLLNLFAALGGAALLQVLTHDWLLSTLCSLLLLSVSAAFRLAYLTVRHSHDFVHSSRVDLELVNYRRDPDLQTAINCVLRTRVHFTVNIAQRVYVRLLPDDSKQGSYACLPEDPQPTLAVLGNPAAIQCVPLTLPLNHPLPKAAQPVKHITPLTLTCLLEMDTDPPSFPLKRRLTVTGQLLCNTSSTRGTSFHFDVQRVGDAVLW